MSTTYWVGWLWHEAARAGYRLRSPEDFAAFQRLRQGCNENGYSLLPFDEKKCIYIHVPKCAGVSVNKALLGCLGGGHTTLRQYRRIFGFREFESYFKFSFSRNPWDRLVSAFHFLKQGGFNEADARWAERNLSGYEVFDDFVKNWLTEERIFSYHHFRPQCHYLCLSKGRVGVDFLGKLETLDVDFKKICDHLGVACSLPEFNKSQRNGYADYYDSKAKDIVYRLYNEDIKTLGYSF
jgi:hypothetical protein